MNQEYKKVVEEINKTFERNLFSLKHRYQYHFALRSWRIKKDERMIQPILSDFQFRSLNTTPKLVQLNEGVDPKKIGRSMLEFYKITSKKRKKRYDIYKKNPDLYFFLRLIHYLFLAKTYSLDELEGFDRIFRQAIAYLKNRNLYEMLFIDGLIEDSPSTVSNHAYYLKYLDFELDEDELIEKIKGFWYSREPKDEVEWLNKIYGLTHLIIASTYFYQRFASEDRFSWVLSLFEREIDKIIERTNADVVSEVGLCFRLCGVEKSQTIAKVKKYIVSKYDNSRGYILKEDSEDSLERAEHRNIIALLLLSSYKRFNSGPNLLSYMKKMKRSIYLPEKGEYVGY